MAPRPPKDDGKKAWDKVTQQATPLDPEKQNRHIEKTTAASAQKPKKAASPSISGKLSFRQPLSVKPALQGLSRPPLEADKPPPLPQIEQKSRRRLGRGSVEIEARLDLHGYTASEAQLALARFIDHCFVQRFTWVLVITGKGMRGEGVLRKGLPDWLSKPPLSNRVAAFDTAAAAHGGEGAFYLRLRKAKAGRA